MLFPVSLPSHGGDTQYVNMHLAYDELPAETKERIDGLKAAGRLPEDFNTYMPGILVLCVSMTIAATIIMTLRLGHRAERKPEPVADPLAETLAEPV